MFLFIVGEVPVVLGLASAKIVSQKAGMCSSL